MGEILHDVERRAAANHAHPYRVVRRVKQIGAMNGRVHKALVSAIGAVGEGHVLGRLIEVDGAILTQALSQSGLSGKLMGKLLLLRHLRGMAARCPGQTNILLQRWGIGTRPRAVRLIEQFIFGSGVVGGLGLHFEGSEMRTHQVRCGQWAGKGAIRHGNGQKSGKKPDHSVYEMTPRGIKLLLC